MNSQQFANWIGRIYATKEEELDCTQTQSLLPLYVETTSGHIENNRPVSDIQTHLTQCPDCMETYRGLCYLVELEADGELSPVDGQMVEMVSAETVAAELIPA